MLTISINEFITSWHIDYYGEDVYTNDYLKGSIVYEDDENIVLKLIK